MPSAIPSPARNSASIPVWPPWPKGCGYPEFSLSHDVARSIWRRGAPLSVPNSGWVGRYLAAAGYVGSDIPAVNIGGEVAGEFIQSATSVLVFNRLQNFGFP
jgi:hypothetical protein